jgi:predicted ABC-type ATPase
MTILPDVLHIKEFINADAIAAGISPFNVESVAFQAVRIMLERIQHLILKQQSFAFETTLATRAYIDLVKFAQTKGYTVTLLFFWLRDPELAKSRVATRVKQGGHNIPIEVINRRYAKGINNLFNHFIHLCNVWTIFDNSNTHPELIAKGLGTNEIEIINEESFKQLKNYVK